MTPAQKLKRLVDRSGLTRRELGIRYAELRGRKPSARPQTTWLMYEDEERRGNKKLPVSVANVALEMLIGRGRPAITRAEIMAISEPLDVGDVMSEVSARHSHERSGRGKKPARLPKDGDDEVDARTAWLIKGMLGRGDPQMDIATYFGVNQARVSEINTGQKYANAAAAPEDQLPPPGPYVVVAKYDYESAKAAQSIVDEVMSYLESIRERIQAGA